MMLCIDFKAYRRLFLRILVSTPLFPVRLISSIRFDENNPNNQIDDVVKTIKAGDTTFRRTYAAEEWP